MPTAIEFENISKQYRFGLVTTQTLSHDLNRWFQMNIRGKDDQWPENALRMATLQANLNIRGTCYFRMVKQSFDVNIAKATKDNPLTNPDFRKLRFRHTSDICSAIEANEFPARALLNMHPQRWNDSAVPWLREWLLQNLKNGAKWWIASR